MELRIQPYKHPEPLVFNYEELKTAIQAKMAHYETAIYSDDEIKQAKADKAALNKLAKALNDERIRLERAYMEPFATFKGQVAELVSIIKKPVAAIDAQVNDYEERQRAEKQQAIITYWEETGAPDWLCTINSSWLNASYSMKTIQAEIDANIAQAEKDLAVIRALPAYAFEAEDYYKGTQSLAEAVSEAHRLQEMAERKAAYEAEQERRKAEQAAREAEMAARKAAEKSPEPVHVPATPVDEQGLPKTWLSFKALLSVDDALALREFFDSRRIEFEAL